MARIFISYAHQDRAVAERLYRDLKRLRLEPWLDSEDLLPGQNWRSVIAKEIREARFFVALLSSHSISKRGFVQEELKLALQVLNESPPDEVFIIPVRIEDCRPRDPRLQELHWVDLMPDYDLGLQGILKTVRGIREEYRGKVVIHVEDEEAYTLALQRELEPVVRYKHVNLLSEAAQFFNDPEVSHFILDLRLPAERSEAFANWGDYPHSATGLIEKLHRERPGASVTVLTNFTGDPEIRKLVQQGLLKDTDVISKMRMADEEFAKSILGRIAKQA
jgi:hypothetical protein